METTVVDDVKSWFYEEVQFTNYFDYVPLIGYSIFTHFGNDYIPYFREKSIEEFEDCLLDKRN